MRHGLLRASCIVFVMAGHFQLIELAYAQVPLVTTPSLPTYLPPNYGPAGYAQPGFGVSAYSIAPYSATGGAAPVVVTSPFGPYSTFRYQAPIVRVPQPIGHQITPTGPNGYVYSPIYANPHPVVVPQVQPAQIGAPAVALPPSNARPSSFIERHSASAPTVQPPRALPGAQPAPKVRN